MKKRRPFYRQRFFLVWLSFITGVVFVFFGSKKLHDFQTSDRFAFKHEPLQAIVDFFDVRWFALKQGWQRNHWRDQMHPSSDVYLLELEYPSRYDFWFDDTTRTKLAEQFKKFPGSIVMNVSSHRLLQDPILKSVVESSKHLIRPFEILPGSLKEVSHADIKIEERISSLIEQTSGVGLETSLASLLKIEPTELNYFGSNNLWGSIFFRPDVSSLFVHEFDLTQKASRRSVPSAILPALADHEGCQSYFYDLKHKFWLRSCKSAEQKKTWELPNPLPLYFYPDPILEAEPEKIAELKSGILILDVVDDNSYFPTFLGDRFTVGKLVATALSNILQGHIPWSNFWSDLVSKILFLLGASFIVFSSVRMRLRGCLTTVLIISIAAVVADFFATFFWNMRLHPIPIFLGLFGEGIVAIATRSIIDFEERGLIERALSGYVSEERLGRLLSGKEKLTLEGRRAELTTMIVDIVKFSKVTADLQIEQIFSFMQKFFGIVDPIIFEFGGLIDKKTGDGLLAFFGDSSKIEGAREAAVGAVEAALQIQEALVRTSSAQLGLHETLQLRIGVNTGEMIIGNTGSQKHFNYTVLGEAVNFTQRLEAACPPGAVLIGEKTAAYLNSASTSNYELEKILISVKHEPAPVPVFQVRRKGDRAIEVKRA